METILQTWATWSLTIGPALVATLQVATAVAATVHVLMHKQSTRAAVGWIGLLWLAPVIGVALYILFGINRIERRARELRGRQPGPRHRTVLAWAPETALDPSVTGDLAPLARFLDQVSPRALVEGNRVDLLENGDTAYPAMLEAIEGAERTVALCTYIFDDDAWGRRFVDALGRAVARGVQVRVLIDAVGARYSFPTVLHLLRRVAVPVARFLSGMPWRAPYLNLRIHRKLLLVDGRVAFTGGMNLREGHVLGDEPRWPVRDLAARMRGPVVSQLSEVFALDWRFTTGELLEGEAWFPALDACGPALARALPDGPDEDFAVASWTLLGALACARRSVRVITPYFVPEDYFLTALATAALRGVEVELLMPAVNNLPYVQWASFAELERLLQADITAWLTPGCFDHTKLMVVDGEWVLLGSANWDARSLRLNFELNVEAWDPTLAARCEALVAKRRVGATRLTRDGLLGRGLSRRLRDDAFRLFKPYL